MKQPSRTMTWLADALDVEDRLGIGLESRPGLAKLLGFDVDPDWVPTSAQDQSGMSQRKSSDKDSGGDPDSLEDSVKEPPPPPLRPKARFVLPVLYERLSEREQEALEAERAEHLKPQSTEDKSPFDSSSFICREKAEIPLRPSLFEVKDYLQLFRNELTVLREGRRLDLDRVLYNLENGRPYERVPYRLERRWAERIALVVDYSSEMRPFRGDIADFLKNARHILGESRLKLFRVTGPPDDIQVAAIFQCDRVIVVSALGQSSGDCSLQDSWCGFGRALHIQGVSFGALVPCGREFHSSQVCAVWPMQIWDCGAPVRTRPSGRMVRNVAGDSASRGIRDKTVEELLGRLSPAVLVESGLLRQARLTADSPCDVGYEYQAWSHPHCDSGFESFNIKSDQVEDYYMIFESLDQQARVALADHILAYHYQYAPLLFLEVKHRLQTLKTVGTFKPEGNDENNSSLVEAYKWLARVSEGPLSDGDKQSPDIQNLAHWIRESFSGLPGVDMQANQFNDGFAASLKFLGRKDVPLPPGADASRINWFLNRGQNMQPNMPESLKLQASVSGGELVLESTRAMRDGQRSDTGSYKIQSLDLEGQSLVGSVVRADGGIESTSTGLGNFRTSRHQVSQIQAMGFQVFPESHLFQIITRPKWAHQMGYDRFGLYCEISCGGVHFRMRWIPPGQFMMGEKRQAHEVTITKGFWLGETQVTQELWSVFNQENPSQFKGLKHPVDSVSWNMCREFCREISNRSPGLDFSLPTEAQWEYACRAGTTTDFSFGSDSEAELKKYAWFDGNSERTTHEVAGLLANPWGLFDMHGNVWEWCLDNMRNYDSGSVVDPVGTSENSESGSDRVLHGGSWDLQARYCRSAYRYGLHPDIRDLGGLYGFRLAAGHDRGDGVVGFWERGAQVLSPWDRGSGGGTPGKVSIPEWADRAEDSEGLPVVFTINGVEFLMRRIEAGSFLMGAPEGEKGSFSDEKPQHRVTISKPFWMGVTPVTQRQWEVVMGETDFGFKGHPENPAENITWYQAVDFMIKLEEILPALNPHLPTEAQWEYACRAGTTHAFYNDRDCTSPEDADPALDEVGWYYGNSKNTTHPVKLKDPNKWGLYDMHGNVMEWCLDGPRNYDSSDQTDPYGDLDGSVRVLRGGSWSSRARYCRSADRNGFRPDGRDRYCGFRLAAGHAPEAWKAELSRY